MMPTLSILLQTWCSNSSKVIMCVCGHQTEGPFLGGLYYMQCSGSFTCIGKY